LLTRLGFQVSLAANGTEAVELFQRLGDIAVVLIDMEMPGLDGIRTLTALHKIDPKVQCCFMTGNVVEDVDDTLRQLGARHIFNKPFRDFETVAAVLRETARPTA
jgi:CheY-like chemotaxis protein